MTGLKAAVAAGGVLLAVAGCSSSGGKAASGSTSPAARHVTSARAVVSSPPATSPAPRTRAATAGLGGTWDGSYSGGYHGTFTLKWTERGSALSGTIALSAPSGTLPIQGVLSNGHISFGTLGSTQITYTGTVSGTTMTGQYEVANGAGGSGSWSASRA